ncbi:peptidylprolyl isomerase [Candidatus Pacearchaeota archaeon]|nr:peptidylprolyl isomerase [Candidatus Pacearchaeota archaeon]
MKLKKKDFIEIEFTGRVKDGEIFDSNIKKDLEKINQEIDPKPFIFPIGQDMFLKGIDEFLIGKEIGEYKIELSAEKAFGKRDPKLIQLMPIRVFKEHNTNPVPGVMFNFDGRMGKVLSVSGGRIRVDFNNPIAGKDVEYKLKILRKVDDKNEQVKALIDFLFRKDFKFEIKGKKLLMNVDKGFKQFVEMFADKFKEILELDLEVKEEGEENEIIPSAESMKDKVDEKVDEMKERIGEKEKGEKKDEK